jgi:hypothetical protein
MNRSRAIFVVSCTLVALVFVVVVIRRDFEDSRAAPANGIGSEPVAAPDGASRSPDPVTSTAQFPLGSGQTLAVSRESLASGEPLAIRLQLAQPEDPGAPLSGRIVTEGRVLDLAAVVGGDASDVAEVEIASDWLTPGRYVIEIRTSERSHFPLRRYALEVR